MTTAIHFTHVEPPAAGRDVFGVQVAVFNWLKAYFRFGKTERFNFLIGEEREWNDIQEIAANVGADPERLVRFDRPHVHEPFNNITTVFRPDPDSKQLLWQRQLVSGTGFNVCGLAHAICGSEAGKLLEQYCLAPSESSDAIVCPSHAIRSVIRSFWDNYGDYLHQRFGINYLCPVQLPVIPLGVDVERFDAIATLDKRAEQRRELGLADGEIVLLWVGRLSYVNKANPLAMFQIAERAAEMARTNLHLLIYGYFMPQDAEVQFRKMAQDFCSTVRVTFVLNSDHRFPDGLWAAADIFLSLVDNIQESFGLTPIEAMAAGLPRIVSDWDGYRDSVEHGKDGFLIRTTQPPPGTGREISESLLTGGNTHAGFLAKSALCVAVDLDAAVEAIVSLVKDSNRRRTIGDAARVRARATYDWRHVISAYETLWQELESRRRIEKLNVNRVRWSSPTPQLPDPFTMYAAYPSAPLAENDRLTIAASSDAVKTLWQHEINMLALDLMIPADQVVTLVSSVTRHDSVLISEIFRQFPTLDRNQMWRTLAWLLKLGIFRRLDLP